MGERMLKDSTRLMKMASGECEHDKFIAFDDPSKTQDEVQTVDVEDNCMDGSGDSVHQDESDDDRRKLFVGGLSWETTEDDLKTYFKQWGNVTQCIIKVDRFTGNSRGFGFVTFDDEKAVTKVLNIHEHKLRNKRIDPKKAKPSKEAIKKIFVGGIDPDLSKDNITEYFSRFGQVESLDLPFDVQKGKRKHYIFVSFTNESAAKKAILCDRQEIYGRQCDVRVAVTREQANRNKVIKQCYGWIDPSYTIPSYSYNDYANAYQSFDPYAYGYYGYECYGTPAAAAAPPSATGIFGNYGGYGSNYLRNQVDNKTSHLLRNAFPNRTMTSTTPHQQSAPVPLTISANDNLYGGFANFGLPDYSGVNTLHPQLH